MQQVSANYFLQSENENILNAKTVSVNKTENDASIYSSDNYSGYSDDLNITSPPPPENQGFEEVEENTALLSTADLRAELDKTKKEQGLIGKAWDGIKNIFGSKNGSKKVEEIIKKAESGEISIEEANASFNKYKNGQEQSVDIVSDVISGITSFAAFSLCTGIGIAAAPFTGGASLGLVAAGIGIAGASGAVSKIAVKGIDAAVGGRKYDSLLYDVATGAVNGVFAPVTAGIGGAVGKTVASRLGVSAVKEGGEIILKEGIEQGVKGAIARTLLTTNISYTGGTILTRGLALSADMATNGLITGAVDSGVRYLAGDEENKTLDGFVEQVTEGAVGGMIAAPVIGGGMRLVGKGVGRFTGKLSNTVSDSYAAAQSNAVNAKLHPNVSESVDKEVVQSMGDIFSQTRELIGGVEIKASSALDNFTSAVDDLNLSAGGLVKNIKNINEALNSSVAENNKIIKEILEDIANGNDATVRLAELAEKGVDISDLISGKILGTSDSLNEELIKLLGKNEAVYKQTQVLINLVQNNMDEAGKIARNTVDTIQKIPETNAFSQLGTLPERTKNILSTLNTKAQSLNQLAESAKKKIHNNNIQEGLEELQRYTAETESFSELLGKIAQDVENTGHNSGLIETYQTLAERLKTKMSSERFASLKPNEKMVAAVEESNIALAKFAQTLSSDDSFPPEVQKIFKEFTSNCYVSRDVATAQSLADELYGAGKYSLTKSLGAGTIGETYLATDKNGTEVVIKILKDGVSRDKFEADRNMFTKYISEYTADETQKQYKLNLINGMFDSWEKELDFGMEAQGAKNLAQGAQRFNVAQTLEVGTKNGQNISLVMEKADGVGLDTLIKLLKFQKENPSDYLTKSLLNDEGKELNPWIKYSGLIDENPWIKESDKWKSALPVAYQKAQNEQSMFMSSTGSKTIHADPHGGNVFVSMDGTTNTPKITYIDTGNVIQRTNAETLKDISLSLNMMIGNSQGVAASMLDNATLPAGSTKDEIAQKFTQLLDERLYKAANVDLKDVNYTQNTINNIMKELEVIPDSSNANLMKATLQRIKTSREIFSVTNTESVKSIDIKDMLTGIWQSFKAHPKETMQTIKPVIKWAYQNNNQALINFFQMMLKESDIQALIPNAA